MEHLPLEKRRKFIVGSAADSDNEVNLVNLVCLHFTNFIVLNRSLYCIPFL